MIIKTRKQFLRNQSKNSKNFVHLAHASINFQPEGWSQNLLQSNANLFSSAGFFATSYNIAPYETIHPLCDHGSILMIFHEGNLYENIESYTLFIIFFSG